MRRLSTACFQLVDVVFPFANGGRVVADTRGLAWFDNLFADFHLTKHSPVLAMCEPLLHYIEDLVFRGYNDLSFERARCPRMDDAEGLIGVGLMFLYL